MNKHISLFLVLCLLLGVGAGASGCARHSSLQKKTASYKRKAKAGKIPCPCESH